MAFLSRLLEAGVDVRFADLPQIEGATGRFLLQQMVAVAELEAGMISARTKAALAAAKRRGKKLGGNRGVKPGAAKPQSTFAERIAAGGRTSGRGSPCSGGSGKRHRPRQTNALAVTALIPRRTAIVERLHAREQQKMEDGDVDK